MGIQHTYDQISVSFILLNRKAFNICWYVYY